MRPATRVYRAAARLVARVLAGTPVRTVYIRRSVAADDTVFARSDLDLGLIIDEADGQTMAQLHQRLRRARVLFPRLGEVQVATHAELYEMAAGDPYRASIDQRAAVVVGGEVMPMPAPPLAPRETMRRLVFWLDHYVPWAVRQRRMRDQRKFVLEMWNALGVLEGWWPLPHVSRRDVAARWARDGSHVPAVDDDTPPFVACLRIAERAHVALDRAVPRLPNVTVVQGARPIVLLPTADTAWPDAAFASNALVVTPPVLDLLLETQLPTLWLEAGPALAALGFAPPSRAAWVTTCIRQTEGARLRLPGFSERGPGRHATRLARLARIIDWLERGADGAPEAAGPCADATSVAEYYRQHFDVLHAQSRTLRARATALNAD